MKKEILLIVLIIVSIAFCGLSTSIDGKGLYHYPDMKTPVPAEAKQAELFKVSEAVFYTIEMPDETKTTLLLAGVDTECVPTAKFCLKEAANHFIQNFLNSINSETVYYIKDGETEEALIWVKKGGNDYLINLLLIANEFAIVKADLGLLEPHYNEYLKIKEEKTPVMEKQLGN